MSENLVVPTDKPHRRWSRRRWLAAAAVLVVAAGGLLVVGSRATYHEWPWSAYPSTLHTCGRDFNHGATQSRAQIEANGDRLTRIGSVPGWLNHGQLWTTSVGAPLPGKRCHMVMWVRTGEDTFESYTLSGGP